MGTWGTGILDDDNSGDFYDSFFEHYKSGKKPNQIIGELKKEFSHINDNHDSICDFWFTISLALWETCSLDKRTLDKVSNYIIQGKDLKIWEKLEADEKTIKERKRELNKFLKKIQVPRSKPKSRKTKKKRPPIFKKGDLISFKLENGNFGGAIVIKENGLKEYFIASNTIILTRINQKSKPNKTDFLNSEILVMNTGDYKDGFRVTMFTSDNYKFHKDDFYLIDQVDINQNLDGFLEKNSPGLTADWRHLQIDINAQIEFEKNNKKPKNKLSVKKFINGSKWGFWK